MADAITPKTSILVVEDEAIVARDIANKLERLGYAVVGIAAQGEEALALARERHPNVVLMDIRLRGAMDGVEAADKIGRECDAAIIFLTAHSDRATLERAKRTEPFGYILKPFEERDLETHIEMALFRHNIENKLRQETAKLQQSNALLEFMNQNMMGRELRMIELKQEVDKLCRECGKPTRYGYDTIGQ